MERTWLILFLFSAAMAAEDPNDTGEYVKKSEVLAKPNPAACHKRQKHLKFRSSDGTEHSYFMSWKDGSTANLKFDWLGGRNFCRQRCMDLVSMETPEENQFVKNQLRGDNINYIWTSGRKCNFVGCDKPSLKPNNVNGWFWAATGVRLPPTNQPSLSSDWAKAGFFINLPQPDNRQFRSIFVRRDDEACLAVLHPALYNEPDGDYHWHDVTCNNRKPVMCEDSDELLRFVGSTNPGLAL